MAEAADFFLRTPTLTASNFAALWPTDPKFLVLKDLLFFSECIEFQGTGSILKVGFALSKWSHFHRVYLVTVHKWNSIAVYSCNQIKRHRPPVLKVSKIGILWEGITYPKSASTIFTKRVANDP